MADQVADLDRTIWQSARTLTDLGNLTADWLDGRLNYCPGWTAGDDPTTRRPDPETTPLVPVLAALNRRGLVTINSQPGHHLNADRVGQRAAVEGLCDQSTLGWLRRTLAGFEQELVVRAYRLDGRRHPQPVPCTVKDGTWVTWFGAATADDVTDTLSELHPDMLAVVRRSWHVVVADVYADNLWPRLLGRACGPVRRRDREAA